MSEKKLTYCFDLDETICTRSSGEDYSNSFPISGMVDYINKLYDFGNKIIIFTARGSSSGICWKDVTEEQCKQWGLKFHKIILGKPSYDIFVDDKAINASDFRKNIGLGVVGFVASSFDLLHAGHCLFLKEAKENCDHLIAALQSDPTCEDFLKRPLGKPKSKPIQSIDERKIQLESCKYVDEIFVYDTEEELEILLKKIKPDIRFLGSDYRGINVTGENYCGRIFYHERCHNYSSSELRQRLK